MATSAHLIHKYYVSPLINNTIYNKKKELSDDVVKINHMLTFGISSIPCAGHAEKEFDCGNLDCNYGRLSYILNFVNNCKTSLDVCIYIITAKLFGDAIVNAHNRGVVVRIIADSDMSFSVQSYINFFRMHEIPTRQRLSPYIMHHKFMIADNEILISGSMNFTMTGAFCNWENVLITSQPQLVHLFSLSFDGLWDEFGLPFAEEEATQKLFKRHKSEVE
ncbi:hypothetical protein AAG570_011260 [Ranatra chinensis]|uniref:Mitochondrial cardiolipin hydrolase n=1 Tax=Ranatra chinensis TaxID=642074 RepID=A0ABD0YYF3_9HEMI